MSYAGAVQAMINSLKFNKAQRRTRKPFNKERLDAYLKWGERKEFKHLSPEELALVRERIAQEFYFERRRQLVIKVAVIFILGIAFLMAMLWIFVFSAR